MNGARSRLWVWMLRAVCACGTGEEAPRGDLRGGASDWPACGGGVVQRCARLADIDRSDLQRLERVWTHHSGDFSDGGGAVPSTSAYQATLILVDETLSTCSPFNRVFALDPEVAEERGANGPKIDLWGRYADQLVRRGVAT